MEPGRGLHLSCPHKHGLTMRHPGRRGCVACSLCELLTQPNHLQDVSQSGNGRSRRPMLPFGRPARLEGPRGSESVPSCSACESPSSEGAGGMKEWSPNFFRCMLVLSLPRKLPRAPLAGIEAIPPGPAMLLLKVRTKRMPLATRRSGHQNGSRPRPRRKTHSVEQTTICLLGS